MDAARRAELEALHGELITLEHAGVRAVFRRPTRAEARRLRDLARDPEGALEQLDALVRATVVDPSAEAFARQLDARPALGDAFGSSLTQLLAAPPRRGAPEGPTTRLYRSATASPSVAAECLLALLRGPDPEGDEAYVGALLLADGIAHLRHLARRRR